MAARGGGRWLRVVHRAGTPTIKTSGFFFMSAFIILPHDGESRLARVTRFRVHDVAFDPSYLTSNYSSFVPSSQLVPSTVGKEETPSMSIRPLDAINFLQIRG